MENGHGAYAINRKESRKYVRKGEFTYATPQTFTDAFRLASLSGYDNGDAANNNGTTQMQMQYSNGTNGSTAAAATPSEHQTRRNYRTVGEIARHFCVNTSAHGWYRVGDTENNAGRTLWIILTVGALACSALHLTLLVVEYLTYPYEIQWKLVTTKIMFPSVTVCNVLPFSVSSAALLMADNTSELYRYHDLVTDLDRFDDVAANYNKSAEFARLKHRLNQPIAYFENIGAESLMLGHQIDDMLLSCSFGDLKTCGVQNFSLYQNPTYYNCYTLTGGNDTAQDTTALVASSTGPNQGLSIVAYLENDSGLNITNATYYTLSAIGNAMGLRVTIHQPGTRPSPLDRGYDVPPGYSASFGMRLRRYKRLGGAYGPCENVENSSDGQNGGSSEPFSYTFHDCQLDCQQQFVMTQCGCISASLPSPAENNDKLTYCGYWNTSDDDFASLLKVLNSTSCESSRTSQFAVSDDLKQVCNCAPPCTEYQQTASVSYSYWPHDYAQQSFYDETVRKHPKKDDLKAYQLLGEQFSNSELIEQDLIRKNFARVNVYIESLSIEDQTEKPSLYLSNLFSSAGGVFGLWIGMSVISWCEVVGLGISILRSFYRRAKSAAEQHHLADVVVVR